MRRFFELTLNTHSFVFADIAQAVERHIGNVEVTGSTPVISFVFDGGKH